PEGKILPAAASTGLRKSDREQQQQGDQEREDAQSFGHGETENQVTKLALSSRRVAQRTRQEAAENVAHAHCGAGHTNCGDTRTNKLCCFSFHCSLLL